MSARTADGVEVRAGDHVWWLRDSSIDVAAVIWAVRDKFIPQNPQTLSLINPRQGAHQRPYVKLADECYSSRRSALLAARDRAAAEVARLDAEIAALPPPDQGGGR